MCPAVWSDGSLNSSVELPSSQFSLMMNLVRIKSEPDNLSTTREFWGVQITEMLLSFS